MKKISAYEIALSALACAFVVIFLTIGSYSEVMLFSGYLFSAIALMLPLSKKSFKGYILAYVGGSILALIFNAARFWDILPFLLFFGLHPLVNELQLRTKINTWVACFMKALWFDGAMYLIWRFVFGMTTNLAIIDQYVEIVILVAGTAFFVFYDYTFYKCRGAVNGFVARFLKK
jgi:hypothetical protein